MANKPFYFCCECKVQISKVDDVLLVDDSVYKGFCSEECIEGFYKPLMKHYKDLEIGIRSKLQLEENFDDQGEFIHQCVNSPDEIWLQTNGLGEKLYVLFKEVESEGKVYVAVGCMMFENRPSFVVFHVVSRNVEIIKEFQLGEKIDFDLKFGKDEDVSQLEPSGFQVADDPDFEKNIEQKKSQELALLIERKKESDIDIENYPLYDEFLHKTLENPDEIYEYKDQDDEMLYCYIKAHSKQNVSFYYICIVFHVETDHSKNQDVLIPLLSFPSLDPELLSEYQKGSKITGQTMN